MPGPALGIFNVGRADVQRLLTSPSLPPKVSVSGHVYDIATGHLTTTHDAQYP